MRFSIGLLLLAGASGLSACTSNSDAGDVVAAPTRKREAPRPAPSLEGVQPQVGATGADGPGDSGTRALGHVAGEPIIANDVLEAWHALSPRDVWLVVDKLVATRLARAEAGRLGLVLPPELLEEEIASERERLDQSVAANAPGVSVEDFIAGRLGVDPDRYFAGIRSATIERMLTERVARAWILSQESRTVRLVVVRAEEAEEVAAMLAGGADMATVASERSMDDSARNGGLVPFLVNTEGSLLAREAFEATVGELVGPLEGDELRLFLRVERVTPARSGRWDALGPLVEESLAATPLSDSEYVPWKLEMERRWPVDLEPLGELLGAAR